MPVFTGSRSRKPLNFWARAHPTLQNAGELLKFQGRTLQEARNSNELCGQSLEMGAQHAGCAQMTVDTKLSIFVRTGPRRQLSSRMSVWMNRLITRHDTKLSIFVRTGPHRQLSLVMNALKNTLSGRRGSKPLRFVRTGSCQRPSMENPMSDCRIPSALIESAARNL